MTDTIYCGQHQCLDRKWCDLHEDGDHCWLGGQRSDTSQLEERSLEELTEYGAGAAAALAFLDAIPVRPVYEQRAADRLAAAAVPEQLTKDDRAWLAIQAAGPSMTEQNAAAARAQLLHQDAMHQAAPTVIIDGQTFDRRLVEGMRVLDDGEFEAAVAEQAETAALIGSALALGPADFDAMQDGQQVTFTSFGPGPDRLSEEQAHKAVQRRSLAELVREKRAEQAMFPGDGTGPSRIPG